MYDFFFFFFLVDANQFIHLGICILLQLIHFSPLGAKGTGVFVIDFTIEFVKVKGRSVS